MFLRKKKEVETGMSDATMLGLFSYGLGIWQVVKPGAVNRFMGVSDHNPNHAVQRILGVREIVSGTGVLFSENTSKWLWFRVAGDVMDISIVGGTAAANLGRRPRQIATVAFLSAILALDIRAAIRAGNK